MIPENFNPDDPGQDNGNYFGMPLPPQECDLVLVSVPWDVTVSYGEGASMGPRAIMEASRQLDFYDPFYPGGWRRGIGTVDIKEEVGRSNDIFRHKAAGLISKFENGVKADDPSLAPEIAAINTASAKINEYVRSETGNWLSQGKLVGLVGGDHSVPYGYIQALSAIHESFSILHIDAHADLRCAYEGFEFSHASIMYNILRKVENVDRIAQVGVRDYCESEARLAATEPRIAFFPDAVLARNRFGGMTWKEQCEGIISNLGKKVYISMDIDGLSPENCPHTGTPVPGGLSFNEAVWLFERVAESGRKVIGFDLCEVAPGEGTGPDGNVGARILFKLCNVALKTN